MISFNGNTPRIKRDIRLNSIGARARRGEIGSDFVRFVLVSIIDQQAMLAAIGF